MTRWNEADLKAATKRIGGMANKAEKIILSARNPIRLPGFDPRMNKTETAYALVLEAQRMAGELAWWRFQEYKLRLADQTYYTPDFAIGGIGGEIGFDEVKGFWRDDARVKFKVAANQFPWHQFRAVQKATKREGGGWKIEVLR